MHLHFVAVAEVLAVATGSDNASLITNVIESGDFG